MCNKLHCITVKINEKKYSVSKRSSHFNNCRQKCAKIMHLKIEVADV